MMENNTSRPQDEIEFDIWAKSTQYRLRREIEIEREIKVAKLIGAAFGLSMYGASMLGLMIFYPDGLFPNDNTIKTAERMNYEAVENKIVRKGLSIDDYPIDLFPKNYVMQDADHTQIPKKTH